MVLAPLPPDVPGAVVRFAASVGFLSVTFTWTPPSFLGVPASLDPSDFIYYILDVRNNTGIVGGATVPHPTATAMVNLTYPCEEYTATIFARNRQAGNGPPTMKMFTLNETSVWQWSPEAPFSFAVLMCACSTLGYYTVYLLIHLFCSYTLDLHSLICGAVLVHLLFWLHLFHFLQVLSMSFSLQRRTLSPTSFEQLVPTTPSC